MEALLVVETPLEAGAGILLALFLEASKAGLMWIPDLEEALKLGLTWTLGCGRSAILRFAIGVNLE